MKAVPRVPELCGVDPIFIGPKNAQSACGVPWRWLRDFAVREGISLIRVGGKSMIPVRPLVAALQRAAAAQAPSRELTDREAVDALCRDLGFELRD
jgi:hypothetical protein